MATPDQIIDDILKAEGGYVNHADDRGGPTNFGITVETLGAHRNTTPDRIDIQNLTEAEARTIYMQQYVIAPGFLKLPEPIQPVMVDAAVLHGPARAVRMLQEAAGAGIDGILGPMTIAAVKLAEGRSMVNSVSVLRLKFIANLVARKPKQVQFLKGWVLRITGFVV